jgi:hypothetical protein
MTFTSKDIRGNWRAEDSINLAPAGKVLQIVTNKTSDGTIVTRATVSTRDGGFLSHMMFQDFSQRLMTAKIRCTEKNVSAQHADAMARLAEVQSAVTAWYAAKQEEEMA